MKDVYSKFVRYTSLCKLIANGDRRGTKRLLERHQTGAPYPKYNPKENVDAYVFERHQRRAPNEKYNLNEDVCARAHSGMFPIHIAAARPRSADIIRLLLEHDAYIEQESVQVDHTHCTRYHKHANAETALQVAVRECNIANVAELLERGANSDVRMYARKGKHCSNSECTILVLERIYAPERVRNGITLFAYVCARNQTKLAKLLMLHGAPSEDDLRACNGRNPLLFAISQDHQRMVHFLLSLPNLNREARTRHGYGVIRLASALWHRTMLDILIAAGRSVHECVVKRVRMADGYRTEKRSLILDALSSGTRQSQRRLTFLLDVGAPIGDRTRVEGNRCLSAKHISNLSSDKYTRNIKWQRIHRMQKATHIRAVFSIRTLGAWRPHKHRYFRTQMRAVIVTLLILAKAKEKHPKTDWKYKCACVCALPNELLHFLYDYTLQAPFHYDWFLCNA